MAETFVWQEHVSLECVADGELTLYSDRVPPGYKACIARMSALGNTAGDGELTRLGVEVNGVKFYLKHNKLTATDEVAFLNGPCALKERDRAFVEFEEANDGELLHLYVVGEQERA